MTKSGGTDEQDRDDKDDFFDSSTWVDDFNSNSDFGEAEEVDDGGNWSGEKAPKNDPIAEKNVTKTIPIPYQIVCSAVGLSNFLGGALIGSLFGTVQGLMSGAQAGVLRDPGFPRLLLGATVSSAGNFGVFLGVFSGTKCLSRGYRKRNDVVNSFNGGLVAGAIGALHTRNPRFIAISGLGSATLMAILESFGRNPD